jgi:hypothetical protein
MQKLAQKGIVSHLLAKIALKKAHKAVQDLHKIVRIQRVVKKAHLVKTISHTKA